MKHWIKYFDVGNIFKICDTDGNPLDLPYGKENSFENVFKAAMFVLMIEEKVKLEDILTKNGVEITSVTGTIIE